MRAGDKYLHVNSVEFNFDIKLQKKEGGIWKDLTANDKVCVLPGGVMNLLKQNLEVKIVHPGEAEDTTIINVKQDFIYLFIYFTYLRRVALQRI